MVIKPFKVLDFVQRIRDFHQMVREDDYMAIRCVREPGSDNILMISGVGNEVNPATEEIHESVNTQEHEEATGVNFSTLLMESIHEGFGVADPSEDDEACLGDTQAQDIFTSVLETSFTMLNNNPYFEFTISLKQQYDGILAIASLFRTDFVENQQVNTCLIQVLYPLSAVNLDSETTGE